MRDILQSLLSADNICLANHSANGFFPEESYSSSSSPSPNGLVSDTTSSFETSSNTGGFDVLEGKETYEEAVCSSENGLDASSRLKSLTRCFAAATASSSFCLLNS